jgi:hypothetical protein
MKMYQNKNTPLVNSVHLIHFPTKFTSRSMYFFPTVLEVWKSPLRYNFIPVVREKEEFPFRRASLVASWWPRISFFTNRNWRLSEGTMSEMWRRCARSSQRFFWVPSTCRCTILGSAFRAAVWSLPWTFLTQWTTKFTERLKVKISTDITLGGKTLLTCIH